MLQVAANPGFTGIGALARIARRFSDAAAQAFFLTGSGSFGLIGCIGE